MEGTVSEVVRNEVVSNRTETETNSPSNICVSRQH